MNCPSCGTLNPADSTFCTQCGTRLAAAAGVDPQAQQAAQNLSRTYLIEAIVVTLCCCQIAGIVAIVYAALASGQAKAGDLAAAERYGRIARRWSIAGFCVGLVIGLLYLVLIILGAVADA